VAAEYRAKMIDWITEVMHTFKASKQAYFLAVSIMDRFFAKISRKVNSNELHLTGICAMFIASKYEDVVPLLMQTVFKKIGHSKFTIEQI